MDEEDGAEEHSHAHEHVKDDHVHEHVHDEHVHEVVDVDESGMMTAIADEDLAMFEDEDDDEGYYYAPDYEQGMFLNEDYEVFEAADGGEENEDPYRDVDEYEEDDGLLLIPEEWYEHIKLP